MASPHFRVPLPFMLKTFFFGRKPAFQIKKVAFQIQNPAFGIKNPTFKIQKHAFQVQILAFQIKDFLGKPTKPKEFVKSQQKKESNKLLNLI